MSGFTGVFMMFCVADAYENARFLCEQYYATAPDCDIECYNRKLLLSYWQFIVTYVVCEQFW